MLVSEFVGGNRLFDLCQICQISSALCSLRVEQRHTLQRFLSSLKERLKYGLTARDEPSDLEYFIDLAIRLDNRLHERSWQRLPSSLETPLLFRGTPRNSSSYAPSPALASAADVPISIQLGRALISLGEWSRQLHSNLCLYSNRVTSACLVWYGQKKIINSKAGVLSSMPFTPKTWLHLPDIFDLDYHTFPLSALIDSGSEENLMD